MKRNLGKIALAPLLVIPLTACNKTASDTLTVTFKNYDGTILQQETVKRGESVEYKKEVPVKPVQGSEVCNVFTGWDYNKFDNVQYDTIYKAQFKKIDKYVDKDHDGMPEGVDPDDNNNYFEVGAKSFVYLNQNIRIDFSKFLKEDANMEYDNEIAKLGLFLSNPKVDFNDGLFTDKAYGGRNNALYSRLGFDDFHHFDFKDEAAKTYKYDPYDTTSGVYGHKYLYDNDGNIKKDLIVIAFEGTNGPYRWASNFDVGCESEMYFKKVQRSDKTYETGTEDDHPEWDDKRFHKGFYIAAKRVLYDKVDGGEKDGPVKFLDYIDKHSSKSNGKPIIFITGHSRGGAMTNILADYFQNEYKKLTGKDCIPFSYAFASPCVFGNAQKIPTVSSLFNIINTDDLVTKVPFSEWGFSRMVGGKEIGKSIIDDGYEALYNENVQKRLYQRIEYADSILHNLKCNGRDEIYNLNLPDNPDRYVSSFALNETSFTSELDANKEIEKMNKAYSEKLGDFFKFIELKAFSREDLLGNTYYDIYANNCLASLTSLVQALMTKNEKVIKNIYDIAPLIGNTRFLEFIASIGLNMAAGGTDTVGLPHDYGAYQIILREYKEE